MSNHKTIVQLVKDGWLVVEPVCVYISDRFQREIVYFHRSEWDEDPENAQICLDMMVTVLEGGVPALLARYPNLRSYPQAEPQWRVRVQLKRKEEDEPTHPSPPDLHSM